MNVLEIARQFPTQESCIEFLEHVKWQGEPECPFCKSDQVSRKHERTHTHRWNCHNCLSTFRVMTGTLPRYQDSSPKVVRSYRYPAERQEVSFQLPAGP